MRPVNVEDYRRIARRRLPKALFEFMDGGAEDEATLRANTTDFDRWSLLPRMLVDATTRDTRTTLAGRPAALPLVLAPTGLAGLFRRGAEASAARAAARAGIPFCLSTMATLTVEEVAAAAGQPIWYQLYVLRDRGLTRSFVERAQAAGCAALVLTVDVQVLGRRERDMRNGLSVPPRVTLSNALDLARRPRWIADVLRGAPITFANVAASRGVEESAVQHAAYIGAQMDPAVTWETLDWCRQTWNGPLYVKGILRADDAARAVEHGATGIVVSNHGGRQLDGAASSLAALPAIVDAVGGRAELILDGGVRRGSHILKALALGADACMVGRPFLYGVTAAGEAGAADVIAILAAELEVAMALAGVPDVAAVDRALIQPA